MHELSIAQAIAAVVRRHAPDGRVLRVEVRLGQLRQVVPRALRFSWGLVIADTELEGAELTLEEVPAGGACRDCGAVGPLPRFPFACVRCDSRDIAVVAGDELLVQALELDDAEPRPNQPSGRRTEPS